MTDAYQKLKRELRRAAPSEKARAKGIEGAMAAFEESFAAADRAEVETKTDDAGQGSATQARLRSAEGADGRPSQRSTPMRPQTDPSSRRPARILGLPRNLVRYGGPSLAAAGLALIVYVQIGSPERILSGDQSANGHVAPAPRAIAPTNDATTSRGAREMRPPQPPQSRAEAIAQLRRKQTEFESARRSDHAGRDLLALRPDLFVDADRNAAPAPTTGEAAETEIDVPGKTLDFAASNRPAAPQTERALGRVGRQLFEETAPAPNHAPKDAKALAEQSRSRVELTEEEASRDRFEKVAPNPVKSVARDPVSTFSIDVDTSAYSFMRASLNRGRLPRPDAVRIEELVNYFDYAYLAPKNASEPFRLNVAVTPTPWNADTKLLHVGIKGYTPPKADRPKANLVLLVDVSGSMQAPNKLQLATSAFKLLLGELGPEDTISIVTYAGGARIALEPTPASEKRKIHRALEGLKASGGTAGAAGLRLAYEKASEGFDKDAVNRVILATDGDFNIGFSSPEEMKRFVEDKRRGGVFLSVLGFGMGNYNSRLMQSLAQNGNGVAAYIDTLAEARKVLADEAGGALIPIAKDVKIQIEFNPSVISEYRLIGYETRALRRQDFKDDQVDAGDIGSGHTVTAIYEITPKGSPAELYEQLRYARAPAAAPAANSNEFALLKLRYKAPDGDVSQEIRRPVTLEDEDEELDRAPSETRFAAAVAAFAQILRGDERLRAFGYEGVLALAGPAKGADPFGYRAEFLTLVRLAQSLDDRTAKPAEREAP